MLFFLNENGEKAASSLSGPSPTGPPAKPGKARTSMLAAFKAPDKDTFYFENREKKKSLHTPQSFFAHHEAPTRTETRCCILPQITPSLLYALWCYNNEFVFPLLPCLTVTCSLLKQSAFYSSVSTVQTQSEHGQAPRALGPAEPSSLDLDLLPGVIPRERAPQNLPLPTASPLPSARRDHSHASIPMLDGKPLEHPGIQGCCKGLGIWWLRACCHHPCNPIKHRSGWKPALPSAPALGWHRGTPVLSSPVPWGTWKEDARSPGPWQFQAALHTLYIKYTAVQWAWNILSMNWCYWRIYILTPYMWELRKICPRNYFQRKCWPATLFVLFKMISGSIMSLYQNCTCAEHAQSCVLWAIQEGVDLIYFFIMNIVVL